MKTKFALRPNAVLSTYAHRNGGDAHTRAIIAMALREGKLAARAAERWTSNERGILKAWKLVPPPDDASKRGGREIPRSLWWRSVCWTDDVLDWDFGRSRMMITVSQDPFKRVMLKGVRFRSDQIRDLLSPGSLNLETGSSDRLGSKEVWRRFWHDVVILAAAGSKESVKNSALGEFKSGDDLMGHIMRNLHHEDEEAKATYDDGEVAEALRQRHPFTLKEDAVRKEVIALRQTLKLKTWGQAAQAKDP